MTWLAVTSGMPMLPNATGAVFAMRQRPAAYRASKPRPTSMLAAMATGAPKPAQPSRNAPKLNAMSSACSRRSSVSAAIECLSTSKRPVRTVTW